MEDEDDEELDEDDLKMYEQFMAGNKQRDMHEEKEEEEEFDDIDYDQLDPQILELAQQMNMHPRDVIKQLQKMQEEDPYGEEVEDEEQEEEEEDHHFNQ